MASKPKKGTPEYREYMNEKRRKQREANAAERAIKRGETESKPPTRQAREDVAGSYLTTAGKKKRILDRAFDYTME